MKNLRRSGGAGTIATAIADVGTLEEVYEPFLIKGFFENPRGRVVTELAYNPRHSARQENLLF